MSIARRGGLGSGSPQLVEESPRSPQSLSEYWRILPFAYAQVVLEAEGRPRCEHHAAFFGEPVGQLQEALQLVQVVAVALGHYPPQGYLGADRSGDAVELLVGGVDGQNVVSRIEQDVEQQEVSLDCARSDQDVLGCAVAIGVRQSGPKLKRAGGLAVSERGLKQPFQDGLLFFRLLEGK